MKRPIGIWCYDKNTNELIKPEDWTSNNVSGGVVVVTEKHSFRVLPHNAIVAQWGDPDKNTTLCRDKNTISGEELTDKIIETYKDIEYNFIGSPAAEFCKSVGGYLPSVVELKIMAENVKEINKCMWVITGQNLLPIGWYWSSIEENSSYAWRVHLNGGDISGYNKSYNGFVRAISAFQV